MYQRLTRALVLLPALLAFQVTASSAAKPNIVVIFTDDQGINDVGCYGSEISTPNIDRLATEGMKLNQFYAASSICTPSRFGLFTGRYAHRSQDSLTSALMFMAQEDKSRGLRRGETTYVSRLRDAGYQTALVGKWHLGHGDREFWPTQHGFDSFYGHTGGCVDFFTLRYGNLPDWYRGEEIEETPGYATDVITNEAIQVLRRSRKTKKPLYLHLAYNAPHFGKGWNEQKDTTENVMQPKPADLKSVDSIRDPLRRSFAAKVVGMDQSIGQLMKEIDDLGMRNETLVIFMTDHGGDPKYGGSNEPLRGDKATLFEGGLRVPCLIRWPKHVKAGSVSNSVACAIDWFPTFDKILGLTSPSNLDGISILPVLRGKLGVPDRELLWKTGAHQLLERKSWRAVRKGKWKLVSPPDHPSMLFDLEADPNETTDVANSHPKVARELRDIVEKKM